MARRAGAEQEGPREDEGDELPEDLDVTAYVGPYQFPDNSRRRYPGTLYLLAGTACFAAWALTRGAEPVLANGGLAVAGAGLLLLGVLHWAAGARLAVDETQAMVLAARHTGLSVGPASAQLTWRGLASRPTWRILLYSGEERPLKRALVLVDGVDGEVVEALVEDNPEDWTLPAAGREAAPEQPA